MTTTRDLIAATLDRSTALETLIRYAENVATSGDTLDMLGGIRLVELALDAARSAIAHEARAEGQTWQAIGDASGTTRQAAQERYTR